MTSLKLKIFLLISAALILPRSVLGHDGWIQVNPIVEKGQPVSIALMHGNHSNEHGSFRLAGKWDAAHNLVQQHENDRTAAWIHAVLHKIEGDLDNARYWYRRADRMEHVEDEPRAELAAIKAELTTDEH